MKWMTVLWRKPDSFMYVTLVSVKTSFTCQTILVWIILLLAVPEFCRWNKSPNSFLFNCLKLLQDNINQVSSASSVRNNGFIIHQISNLFLIHYYRSYCWIFTYKSIFYTNGECFLPCLEPTAVKIWIQFSFHLLNFSNSSWSPAIPFYGETKVIIECHSFLSPLPWGMEIPFARPPPLAPNQKQRGLSSHFAFCVLALHNELRSP